MGLLKASIILLAGTFILSILEHKIEIVKSIPIIGTLYGGKIKKLVKTNKSMLLLVGIIIVEFIL